MWYNGLRMATSEYVALGIVLGVALGAAQAAPQQETLGREPESMTALRSTMRGMRRRFKAESRKYRPRDYSPALSKLSAPIIKNISPIS